MYQYSPRLVLNPISKNVDHKGLVQIQITWDGIKEKFEMPLDISPEELIREVGEKLGFEETHYSKCYVKTVGEASFLLGDHKLYEFAFINENAIPELVILPEDKIEIEEASDFVYIHIDRDAHNQNGESQSSAASGSNTTTTPLSPSAPPSPTLMARSLPRKMSLTTMSLSSLAAISPFQFAVTMSTTIEKPFNILVEMVKFSLEGSSTTTSGLKFSLQIGLYHGGRPLCPLKTIVLKGVPNEEGVITLNNNIEFDISVSNLPRMAKLCFALFEKRNNKGAARPISWVNTNLFDYQAKFRKRDTLHMWKYFIGGDMPTHEMLSPLRTNIGNPNTKDSTSIVLRISEAENLKIQFPPKLNTSVSSPVSSNNMPSISETNGNSSSNEKRILQFYGQELASIANYDPLHQLTIQEKDLIWRLREYCLENLPKLLPKIIDCVDYANRVQVTELHNLLDRWPLLSPEDALQLFDFYYPDEQVRRFAVKCLRKASDDIIDCYLLQLAQSLKHEAFFQCDLVEFLLERALNNQHIGHKLFWELKAEMNSPSVGLYYGLILEAYLVAAPEHLKILDQQVRFLDKCRSSQVCIQKMELTGRNFEKAKDRFLASSRAQFNGFSNFINPLTSVIKCKRIVLDKCRLMNSKNRPQMLFFENSDHSYFPTLDPVTIMYKKGDDLRQDRLTLQLLSVMDRIWKQDSHLDLRLNIYKCMSTSVNEGLIEVVSKADTVCKIQMKYANNSALKVKSAAAFNKGSILAWLKQHNQRPEEMKAAQQEFTKSCAGYSVATYILGIADRHNDNIMIRTNGQLFHIDFGHFLGNFKHKFGIKRERVAIVLPSEFVAVISTPEFGLENNFVTFQKMCEEAFLAIRRRGSLIISLLTLMISTGLPELTSEQDLYIVRTTLRLDQATEQEAVEMFRKDFNESLGKQWTVSVNWWAHMFYQIQSKGIK